MIEQLDLFPVERRADLPRLLTVVFRYDLALEAVVSHWPQLSVNDCRFPSWSAALDQVLHPLTIDRVRVKVRVSADTADGRGREDWRDGWRND